MPGPLLFKGAVVTFLKNKFSGDVQEFVPSVVEYLVQKGDWVKCQAPAEVTAAGPQETAMLPGGSTVAAFVRPQFARGPITRRA